MSRYEDTSVGRKALKDSNVIVSKYDTTLYSKIPQNDNDISNNSSNRDTYGNFDLNSYQLASTPTSASTKTAITYVIKADNHGSNARKVYVYYGNTKVHTFANLIPASKEIHWWCATGHASASSGDYWTNNSPRIRFGKAANTDYDVGG